MFDVGFCFMRKYNRVNVFIALKDIIIHEGA